MTHEAKGPCFVLGLTVFLMMITAPAPTKAQSASRPPTWEQTLGLCASCHGVDGKGMREVQAPRLAGQGKRYLTEQLLHFAQGRRGTHAEDVQGQAMAASVALLDEITIARLADYYASLGTETDGTPAPQQAHGPETPGATLYAAHCAACHGPSAEGLDVLYVPNLAVLDAAYLRRQIEAYRKGWRGGDNASTRAKGMRQMSFQFQSVNEIDEVVRYLTGSKEETVPQGIEL